MHTSPDQIIISQLGISTYIGATEEERRKPQRLRVTVIMDLANRVIDDKLENTVDYAEVSGAIKALAAISQRLLIETLAEQIATMLLAAYPLSAVEIELRKYILPDTEFVAVRIRRS